MDHLCRRSRSAESSCIWSDREQNPELAAKGNIRDFADLAQLNVLANLEGTNAILIERGMHKEQRFEILSQAAISQYHRLSGNDQLKQIGD